MTTTIIAAASRSDALLAASQVIAFAAFTAAQPTALIALGERPPRTELIPSLSVTSEDAPRVLQGLGSAVSAFVRINEASAEAVEPLLALADAFLIATTRFPANVEESFALYRSVRGLQARGRSGQLLEPWLLPVGWSSTRRPTIRLRDWQRDLQRLGEDDLRCLPLVLPWHSLGSVVMANPARLQYVGETVLRAVAEIAKGCAPERPERGIDGGDPWPISQTPSEPPLRIAVAGLRPRFRLVEGTQG